MWKKTDLSVTSAVLVPGIIYHKMSARLSRNSCFLRRDRLFSANDALFVTETNITEDGQY